MLAQYRQVILEHIEPLTTWQKWYFAAALFAIFDFLFGDESYSYEIVGALALAGLAVEMWPKFVQVWETLLGRVIVVFSYAIVGNFVVAFARHELNEVVGVDPGSLFYATSFASVLFAPVWIITITLIAMLLYMLVKQAWFIITFIPWLLGLYKKSNNHVAVHPKTTRVIRIVMLPFMIAFLISVLEVYSGESSGTFVDGVKEGFNEGHEQANTKTPQQGQIEPELSGNNKTADMPVDEVKEDIENITEMIQKSKQQASDIDEITIPNLLAEFVYYVEGFAYSQCEMEEKERVVSLGEYDILAIKPDDSQNGYSFTVRSCKLKNYGKPTDKVLEQTQP